MSRRGSTGPGRPAALPAGPYSPPPIVEHGSDSDDHSDDLSDGAGDGKSDVPGLLVHFHGEDERRAVFQVDELPLPGWHLGVAAAFAARIGPTGTIRTLAGARSNWQILGRFVRFLATLPAPPRTRPLWSANTPRASSNTGAAPCFRLPSTVSSAPWRARCVRHR